MNKIFGAVLATGLAILGLQQVSALMFHAEAPEKPGYAVAVQEASAEGAGAVADTPPDWGTVLPTADVTAGQTVSSKCASCHSFAPGGPDMTGPDLYGVVGRKPGSHAGFAYSTGMTEEGTKLAAWDFQHLYEFLASPQGYVKGTKMTFVGLKKREDRINLIAWLRTQSASPMAIPAADPAAAAAAQAPAGAQGSAPGASPVTVGGSTTAAASTTGTPAAAATGAPANAVTGSPGGQAATAGAAAAPTAVKDVPGGKRN